MNVLLYTLLAMVAFAANSVLCRIALGNETIDAASFTALRLASGALVLTLLVAANSGKPIAVQSLRRAHSWFAPLALFVYAAGFSWAYQRLDTGTGALLLFGTVQITLIIYSVWQGQRLTSWQLLGSTVAFGGFLSLVWPNLSTPALLPSLLMILAGLAWAAYTALGAGSKNALGDTAQNFVLSVPMAVLLMLLSFPNWQISGYGALLAMLSGALASGVGYAVWYAVLPKLASIQAAVVQLLVPIVASMGGVIFMAEQVTLLLFISSLLVLGGVFMVVYAKK